MMSFKPLLSKIAPENSDIVKGGCFFQFVSRVHTQLMRQDIEQYIINT